MSKSTKIFFTALFCLCSLLFSSSVAAQENDTLTEAQLHDEAEKENADDDAVDVKEIIFHHLGDGYGWEVPFCHAYRIPLPVIVKAEDGEWFCFSSAKLTKLETISDAKTGMEKEELVPVIYKTERNGKEYLFTLAHASTHKNKVVELFDLTPAQQAEAYAKAVLAATDESKVNETAIDGYCNVEGTWYREYKPWDFSITKNVLALFISAILVTMMVMAVVRFYAKKGLKAPRKGMGFMELLIDFVYTGVIKATLGDQAKKYAPYLLTCFFFILTMNLLGLIVIFPGGANLTGNIAITLVLAVLTFIMTNTHGTKHYWKELFWPDVPIWLKCPLPIMQVIEIFGAFTKPAALCVRLFANMMGGHMIVITLTLLIFIFAAFGTAAASGATVISILFSLFMLALDVLVSFIQAYVFTTLSTMFISAAVDKGHHDHSEEPIEGENVTNDPFAAMMERESPVATSVSK
ncbi:MAG: F0F1 ATP synthase subunit A [Clostridium sp.]|nr:F0F1 ATP synthase subunit A [Prevotella sp.]MCM1429426.1 F0F1 ATP synthase subunit A [Clostridium sp.]MCM1475539.1 F0F1 ATP synthase subunit A [Muribaculaceae bacterium]